MLVFTTIPRDLSSLIGAHRIQSGLARARTAKEEGIFQRLSGGHRRACKVADCAEAGRITQGGKQWALARGRVGAQLLLRVSRTLMGVRTMRRPRETQLQCAADKLALQHRKHRRRGRIWRAAPPWRSLRSARRMRRKTLQGGVDIRWRLSTPARLSPCVAAVAPAAREITPRIPDPILRLRMRTNKRTSYDFKCEIIAAY